MKQWRFHSLLLILMLIFVDHLTAWSAAGESSSKILVLYKQRDPDHENIVNFLTGFLEKAGYAFDKQDIEELLTKQTDMTPYSGIMTCYQTPQMIHGDRYPFWLVKQMEAGRRILIIGNYGAYQAMAPRPDGSYLTWNESTQIINTFFYPFGLEFYFAFTQDNDKLSITKADKKYAQFQHPITQGDLHYYQLFKSIHPDNQVFFELERTDMPDSRSALNVITPFGGMITEGYAYQWKPEEKKIVLRVDFPKFMKEVFSATSPAVPTYDIISHAELIKQHPVPERPLPKPHPALRPTESPRHILVPYKKSEVEILEDFTLYKRAAVVLEYLGMIPVYWAVEDGLPTDEFMDRFRGIVTWHTNPYMHQAQQYGDWLVRHIQKGKRVVILGEYGASYDIESQKPVSNQAEVFRALGVKFVTRRNKREAYIPKLRMADMSILGYERKFDPRRITYENTYTSTDTRNKVFLSFADREFGVVDLGIITSNGGMCMRESPYQLPYDDERIERFRRALKNKAVPEISAEKALGAWIINPFRFFSETLGLDQFPAPDVTTLNGSRIFYAHIDGDAFESVSLIDRAHFAGFIIYEEILKQFSDIPTTASIITMPIETRGNQYYHPAVELARKIFLLPNIDIAVHSATHPFNWITGDPYVSNPGEYPYAINRKHPDLIQEIWGSKLFADTNLAPPHKKTETIFWSGETNPGADALEIAWRSGLHNINGGDPRYDDEYPFLENVCPYSQPKGSFRQYLTSAQNDYVYSQFLRGDWGGQKKVLQHYAKTDTPHRIFPMNLYYHFYAGIKKESLDALRYVYDSIRSIDAAPIYTKNYLEIAEDYYDTHVGFDGQAYWVENNGFLRTIRFNRKIHVDIRQSRGVLGYCYHNNQTYVHLDGSRYREIRLAKSPPTVPYLVQATQYVDQYRFDGSKLSFMLRGFGRIFLKIAGLAPVEKYEISLEIPGQKAIHAVIGADREGVVAYRIQLPPPSTSFKVIFKRKQEE